ncbi:chemotaxis protein CheW [Eubacteriales bacterium OttesenSCG-928-M02]|nr:chemotaxis protein CheW [Eubacteriales bacterium OttesenSCG-928-M02]
MTMNLAEPILPEEGASTDNMYLTFYLADVLYGIPIRYVTEIIGLAPITQLPQVPPYIKGIMNLRGSIVPLMDLRLRFSMPVIPYTDRTCVIVTVYEGVTLGLIVDQMAEVLTLDEEMISPPPTEEGKSASLLSGIGKTDTATILILHDGALFDDEAIPTPESEERKDDQ